MGVIVGPRMTKSVHAHTPFSERIQSITFTAQGQKINFINIYAPIAKAATNYRTEFYNEVSIDN